MENDYIEVTEKTLDDAITSACQKLSVTSDRLEYEVISEGSSGFLGMGAKPAVIRARVKQISLDDYKKNPPTEEFRRPVSPAEEEISEAVEDVSASDDGVINESTEEETEAADNTPVRSAVDDFLHSTPSVSERFGDKRDRRERAWNEAPKAVAERDPIPEEKQLPDETVEKIKDKANTFLTDVFKAMEIEVSISLSFDKEWNSLDIDLEGDDMGILIGKRGQTLDSLQYLVSLVVNREVEPYIHVKADTENYRARRKATLENLARNIASKVKRTHRPVELEPMNPYERRIIHSALQNDRYVTTHSEGEEPYRKVVVTPRNG